jgi:hypothetical protein
VKSTETVTQFVYFVWDVPLCRWVAHVSINRPVDRECWTIKIPLPAKLVNPLHGVDLKDAKDV